MSNQNIKNLLMDIPTKLCRNMNRRFVNNILNEIQRDLAHHHFMILKLLGENERLYVTEIVDALSITKPQMTASADKLIKLGYVTRINDDNDRRKVFLSITKKGIEITSKIKENMDIKIDKNLIKLTNEELEDFEKGLKLLYKFCSLYK